VPRMKSGDILFVVSVAGFALTLCYIVSMVVSFKAIRAADLASLLNARELYNKLHAVAKPLLERRKIPRTPTKAG
jgi:hypothetical protein